MLSFVRRAVARQPLVSILVVAAAVRLALVAAASDVGLRIVDEQHYFALATSIVHGNGFAWAPGQPTSLRPPLYPAFVAFVRLLTRSDGLTPVRLAQIPLALAAITLVFAIARRLFDRRAAILAAAFVAFYPSLLFSGVLVLSESLFIALFLAAVLSWIVLVRDGGRLAAVAGGLLLGLSALTRSIVWPLPVVLVPFLGVAIRRPMRERAILIGLTLLGYGIVIAPWAVRNTRLQHTFTIVDTMGGINLLTGNYAYTPEDRMWDGISMTGDKSWFAPMLAVPGVHGWTEGEKERWARTQAVAFMRAHPGLTLKRAVLKLADLWGLEREWVSGLEHHLYAPSGWFAVASSAAVLLMYPLFLLLVVWGLCATDATDARARWLIVTLVAFTSALHAITFGHSRYHLPLVPLLAPYAAAALTHRRRIAARVLTRGALLPAAATLLCVAIWVREIGFRDAQHVAVLLSMLR